MPKCDFNNNFIEITLRHGCSPVNLLHIFRIPFRNNTSGRLLLLFIVDRLQSRCYLTFLISLFVTSRNLLFGVFLPVEKSRKYQASVTERCASLSKRSGMFRQNLLQVPLRTSSQMIFKISRRIFFHLFTYPPIYRTLLVPYIAHIIVYSYSYL